MVSLSLVVSAVMAVASCLISVFDLNSGRGSVRPSLVAKLTSLFSGRITMLIV